MQWMGEIRNWVEAILYGGGTHRRFTQDGPVLPDVWTSYLEQALEGSSERRVAVLIEPHFDSNPAVIARRMKGRLGADFEATQTVYNRTVASSWLHCAELVGAVVPLTRWYLDIASGRSGREGGNTATKFDGAIPS